MRDPGSRSAGFVVAVLTGLAGLTGLTGLAGLAATLGGCGHDAPPTPRPAPDAQRPTDPDAPRGGAPETGSARPGEPRSVTITQIWVAYGGWKGSPKRTREEARQIARDLIAKFRQGTPIDALLRYSDDKDELGEPYNRGSYTFTRASPAHRVILDTAFSTPIGEVAPEPVDSGAGWHVIYRDA